MANQMRPFADESVAAAFDRNPPPIRARLLDLRQMIFDVAETTEGVGDLVESLKWGQPAYAPAIHCVGTPVRLDALRKVPDGIALFFHCQTRLVGDVRQIYPETFRFDGNRAIIFALGDAMPTAEVRHCIAMALTYHRRSKR